MDKTALEKLIEVRAENQVKGEYNVLRTYIGNNEIGKRLTINGDDICKVIGGYSNSNKSNIEEAIEKRKQEIAIEVTIEIVNKLSSIEYLFNKNE